MCALIFFYTAFAEFQIEVSDFSSDFEQPGIPFWDFKTYAYKVLFPKPPKHPVLTVRRNVSIAISSQCTRVNYLMSCFKMVFFHCVALSNLAIKFPEVLIGLKIIFSSKLCFIKSNVKEFLLSFFDDINM